jgi:hypothetical protein
MAFVAETVRDIELGERLGELRRLVETSRVPEARRFVKELVQDWPDEPRVQHWDKVLAPPVARAVPGPGSGTDRSEDLKWLQRHAKEYPGCWIAVYQGRFIAADPSPDRVAEKIKSALPPGQRALLHFEAAPEE